MTYRHPFYELDQLHNEIDRMFGSFFRPMEKNGRRSAFLPGVSARAYPKINLYDDVNNYYVEALAPGIDPTKLEVSITGGVLTLSGEKTAVPGGLKPEAFHRSERAAGRFIRTIELPNLVDANKIKAEYKNGILLITLPRAEESKPKAIAVKVS
ncbi:MAG: Hsp20/alpha crystallin family protein [Candidatus Omnitrophica bacterium]|nr:Hsp20/alpha crystallin family protein [Candidatus Omnitrophota bacterium]